MSDLYENNDNKATDEPQEKKKLTDMQLRIIQLVTGVLCALAMNVALYLPTRIDTENSLLQYAFLFMFLIIMFGRRWVENKFRVRLGLFNLALIDGIMVGIILFAAFVLFPDESVIKLSAAWKLVILTVASLGTVALGVVMPLMRYFKRKENGTLPPIRIPERQEPKEGERKEEGGPLTVEQKIAEMMREINDNEGKSGE